jgi:hypothetical protein
MYVDFTHRVQIYLSRGRFNNLENYYESSKQIKNFEKMPLLVESNFLYGNDKLIKCSNVLFFFV